MTTKHAFVMGHPVSHSRSPMLHGYWLSRHGIDGVYDTRDVMPDAVGDFMSNMRSVDGWAGGNVTIPHKLAVMKYCDRIDDAAQQLGAVNTLWFEDGQLVGGNTDWIGLVGNLDEQAPGWDANAGNVVVLGAGGAARAAIYGMLQRGMTVQVVNRTVEKARELAAHFGSQVSAHGTGEIAALLGGADLLINTTSLGMKGQPPLDIDLSGLKDGAVVYDVIYVPLETALLKQAAEKGHRTVDGLGMLLHQAVDGFEHWFGVRPEVTAELRQMIIDDLVAKGQAG
ncbi:MAG: shikimate dehydrogenase [Nitratireductor sp.]|nr:shikimate dehydrogenase [Nitratireductor sp.]